MNDAVRNTITGDIVFSTVIQGRDVNVVLPPRIVPAMTGLPPATPSFTGRDADLVALLDTLAPAKTAGSVPTLVTAAVGGMAGIGKTELALQAARTALARGWFPGGVLFTDMRGYDADPALRREPGQALEGFLRAVGVPGEHIPTDEQDRSRLLRSVLATYASGGRRVLVIVDNVSTGTQALPLLPSDGVCATIVTSRHVLADLDARLLNLDALPDRQATDLLDTSLRLRDPADSRVRDAAGDAERLAALCAGLPLALQLVAAQLAANPGKSLAAMTADLDDAASRLGAMAFADRAVHAVFDSSYRRLTEPQARLFRLLSLNPGPDVAGAAAAALTGLTEPEAGRVLESLAQAHLVEPGTVHGRWRMHDLLRLHSAHHGREDADRDQALTRLLDYYVTTTKAANAHVDPRVTDPARLGFADQAAAMAWLDAEYPNLTAATYTAASAHPAVARDLPQAMWHFLLRRRHLTDWISLSGTAIDASRALSDRDGEATAHNSLGSALQELGRYAEAIDAHTGAARIYRELGDRHGEGKALINLGAAQVRDSRFDQAVAALREAGEIFHEAGDRLHEAMALQNLGAVLRLTHRAREARDVDTGAVGLYRALGDRHGEAMALNNLGLDLAELNRLDEAIDAHQDAARLHRETGDRHGENGAWQNLGTALGHDERHDEAVDHYRAAARLYRETGDHSAEGESLNGVGRALGRAGRLDDAVAAHQAAARLHHETGDRHGENGAWQNLGITYRELGRFEEAVTAHRASADICRELGDRFHEAAALHGLGMALREVGRLDEAVTACRDAATIFGELGDHRNERFALDDLERARRRPARWWRRKN